MNELKNRGVEEVLIAVVDGAGLAMVGNPPTGADFQAIEDGLQSTQAV